jgi:hypothetical protein
MLHAFVRLNPLACCCAAGVLLSLAGTGCRKPEVTTYDIPKEQEHAHSQVAADAGARDAATDPHAGTAMPMPRVKVAQVPEGWIEDPNPGSMRAASYTLKGSDGSEAEVVVIPMGGMANMELQLVNMWREQLKLTAISDADMASLSTDVIIAGEKGKLFELASQEAVIQGKQKARILAAMLKQADLTWFFKCSGENELVAANKQKFVDFLKGVTFEAAAMPPAGGTTATGQGMMSGSMGMSGGDTVPPGSGDQPQWDVPASWTEVAHSSFLVAKFQMTGEGANKAEVNVSRSAGAGGGLLANVNRWRGQLSLGAMDQPALDKVAATIDLADGKATMVDFSGEGAENSDLVRCIGIMVPHGEETWFYKLMGSASVVAREKEPFLKFVRSVKY